MEESCYVHSFSGRDLVAVLAVRAFMAGNTQEGWFDLHIDLLAVVCGFCLPIAEP